MTYRIFLVCLMIYSIHPSLIGQIDHTKIAHQIQAYKEDIRGPYKDIKWFCPDGSVIGAKETCAESGGYQRARYKDEVQTLATRHNIYIGQILKGNTEEEFYDAPHQHSKVKQYIIEQFLRNADNGWVLQKAQYYRGAFQAEDEETWGSEFLLWLFDNTRYNPEYYFLSREILKSIPHGAMDNTIVKIRSLSKSIADSNESFMKLRSKIHGNPNKADLDAVKLYQTDHANKLKSNDQKNLTDLIANMETYYGNNAKDQMLKLLKKLGTESSLHDQLKILASGMSSEVTVSQLIRGADLLEQIKDKVAEKRTAKNRLTLFDISIQIEQYLLANISNWNPSHLDGHIEKICYLAQITNATGYTYDWEYNHLLSSYTSIATENCSFELLYQLYKTLRRNINWASSMIETEYGLEIKLFSGFEPLTVGFTDDRIRSSALLSLGEEASILHDYLVKKAKWKNDIFGKSSSSIQGINPGYAYGKLIIVDKMDTDDIDPKAIYLFRNPPSDLDPVAGILSISEGNMVSHLQLLARNLGIPNANISEDLYDKLKKYEGQEIFYAVSNRGGVKLSTVSDMSSEEKKLFTTVATVDDEVVTVPVDKIQLSDTRIYTLDEIDNSSSGIICGPKAANFSELKKIFPEHLVNGLVISFAVFKDHMLQQIPTSDISYWDHLTTTFDISKSMTAEGKSNTEVELYILNRLAELSSLIKEMPLKTAFIKDLEASFVQEFGTTLGATPVFLRSDTNMEDLKDFTGAGLNLTVFNTTERQKIMDGIRNVWASPYSDRSYKWRQRYLTNPQDVYPSILVIPSVAVDYSGVIITKDFIEGKAGKVNLALSLGVGGAVDGQKAEAWVLSPNEQNILISPARDRSYKRLGNKEGTEQAVASLNKQILTAQNTTDIWKFLSDIYIEMPKTGMSQPYDIELGFKDNKLWLFQIRPFVENKKASSSIYLSKLDPIIPNINNITLADEIIQ